MCVSKLCVGKLCVGKWCVEGRREEGRKEADGSAQPKTRTPHNEAGKNGVRMIPILCFPSMETSPSHPNFPHISHRFPSPIPGAQTMATLLLKTTLTSVDLSVPGRGFYRDQRWCTETLRFRWWGDLSFF